MNGMQCDSNYVSGNNSKSFQTHQHAVWVNCRLLSFIAVGRPVYNYESGLNWFLLKITTLQNSLAFSRRLQVNDMIISIFIQTLCET